ncbi:hypothetical protein PR048_015224 [Dryococelus australis]|uniref:Hexosyltransferase n=1 Tax=Dryococelus australis TaxID=614101 RepID=A0ABQ9HGD4_9NEOP|nr:hypothetical protein PR048_015224 [Dryococelus australis]
MGHQTSQWQRWHCSCCHHTHCPRDTEVTNRKVVHTACYLSVEMDISSAARVRRRTTKGENHVDAITVVLQETLRGAAAPKRSFTEAFDILINTDELVKTADAFSKNGIEYPGGGGRCDDKLPHMFIGVRQLLDNCKRKTIFTKVARCRVNAYEFYAEADYKQLPRRQNFKGRQLVQKLEIRNLGKRIFLLFHVVVVGAAVAAAAAAVAAAAMVVGRIEVVKCSLHREQPLVCHFVQPNLLNRFQQRCRWIRLDPECRHIFAGEFSLKKRNVTSFRLLQISSKPKSITNAARWTKWVGFAYRFEAFVCCTPIVLHRIVSIDVDIYPPGEVFNRCMDAISTHYIHRVEYSGGSRGARAVVLRACRVNFATFLNCLARSAPAIEWRNDDGGESRSAHRKPAHPSGLGVELGTLDMWDNHILNREQHIIVNVPRFLQLQLLMERGQRSGPHTNTSILETETTSAIRHRKAGRRENGSDARRCFPRSVEVNRTRLALTRAASRRLVSGPHEECMRRDEAGIRRAI